MNRKFFSKEEDSKIIKEFPYRGGSLVYEMPNRTRSSIKARAYRLGIKSLQSPGRQKGCTTWSKGKQLNYMKGSNNPNWSGGKYATERKRLMRRAEYQEWRKVIFERDNYTCQLCYKRGGDLEADHIKPFYTNPELALDLNNGRTLCIPCHKSLDTWGHKVKTRYKK